MLPRTGANLVKWCPAVTVAWGFNNNITTAIDIDSYDAQQARSAELRAMHRQCPEATQQAPDGEDTDASAAESDSDAEEVAEATPTIESNSLKQSEYQTKYHSKPDNEGACEDLANVTSRVALMALALLPLPLHPMATHLRGGTGTCTCNALDLSCTLYIYLIVYTYIFGTLSIND